MLAGQGVTLWLLVGTFLKKENLMEQMAEPAKSGLLDVYTEGCGNSEPWNVTYLEKFMSNATKTRKEFFYVPIG